MAVPWVDWFAPIDHRVIARLAVANRCASLVISSASTPLSRAARSGVQAAASAR